MATGVSTGSGVAGGKVGVWFSMAAGSSTGFGVAGGKVYGFSMTTGVSTGSGVEVS